MDDIYLPNEKYDAVVGHLLGVMKPLSVIPDRVQDLMTEDQIKIALGEIGDIWPAGIKE